MSNANPDIMAIGLRGVHARVGVLGFALLTQTYGPAENSGDRSAVDRAFEHRHSPRLPIRALGGIDALRPAFCSRYRVGATPMPRIGLGKGDSGRLRLFL